MFKVIGTSGDSKLGGDDFDQLLLNHILSFYPDLEKNDLSYNDLILLTKECKTIKEKFQSIDNFQVEFEIKGKKKKKK